MATVSNKGFIFGLFIMPALIGAGRRSSVRG